MYTYIRRLHSWRVESLGYRIKSVIATRFRQWATQRLKEYMIKGFTIDDERLKGNGGGNYWKELLDRIRDIGIAKNYLEESELKVLNNLVSGYFDLAEINAIEHKPMYMDDYVIEKAYLESIKEVSKEVKRR